MADPFTNQTQYSTGGLPVTYVPSNHAADGEPVENQWKDPVSAHTVSNVVLAGIQIVDGVQLEDGDRVLVKDQTIDSENGIYNVSAGDWTRARDMYLWSQFPGAVVSVAEGASVGDTLFLCFAPEDGTVGITANNWISVSTQATVVGTITPLRAYVSDATGNAIASSATSQEIAYVSGVTGPIQGQLNGIASTADTAFSIATSGTSAAATAQSTANAALSIAETGTNVASAAFAIAVAGTSAAAAALSTANSALAVANFDFTLAVAGTNAAATAQSTANSAYSIATAGTSAAASAQSTANSAYTVAVAGTTIGSIAYNYALTLGDKYVRTTRFVQISSGTSGVVSLPANSTVVLDDFGGTTDAIVTSLSGGLPAYNPVFTAGGAVVATSFNSSGNYALSGAPAAYPVAIVYRVRQLLSQFDSTSADIIGSHDVEQVAGIAGTQDQVYVNGSIAVQEGTITLSLPQSIATTSSPTFANVYATNITAISGTASEALSIAISGTTAAAAAQSTANAAFTLAQVGTNVGTNAYTLASSGSNAAYSAFTIAVSGTSAAASAQSTANAAFTLAQVGTNVGTNAYNLASSGSNVAYAAYVLAVAGTNAAAADNDRLSIFTITSGVTSAISAGHPTYLANSSGGQITVNLPNTLTLSGVDITVTKISSDLNPVTVQSITGTQTINASTTQVMYRQGTSISVTTDGTNWYII